MIDFDVDLELSSMGLSKIPLELYNGEFEFFVGSRSYKCSTIIAEFLSPKISALRRADPTVSEYHLQVEDSSSKFADFISLAFQSRLKVRPEDFDFFVSVSRELENAEVLSKLVSRAVSATGITTSNAVQCLRMKELCVLDCDEEISFIAANFGDIEKLSELEIHHLRRILGHSSLRIQSEDVLYEFICTMIAKDPSFSELFEFVIFKFLSDESIKHFVNSSPNFIFDHLNAQIWKSLCDRLAEKPLIRSDSSDKQRSRYGRVILEDELEKSEQRIVALTRERDDEVARHTESQNELSALRMKHEALNKRVQGKQCLYNESNPFNGIMAELRTRCGGNPHQKLVTVSASSINTSWPHQVLDYGWYYTFWTDNQPNSWIELDLMEQRVSLTHYTLKSRSGNAERFFKHWVIECSNDRLTWTVVDERHTDDLCGLSRVRTYPVHCEGFYRYVRMRQTGKNSSNEDHLVLTNMEIFGTLRT